MLHSNLDTWHDSNGDFGDFADFRGDFGNFGESCHRQLLLSKTLLLKTILTRYIFRWTAISCKINNINTQQNREKISNHSKKSP